MKFQKCVKSQTSTWISTQQILLRTATWADVLQNLFVYVSTESIELEKKGSMVASFQMCGAFVEAKGFNQADKNDLKQIANNNFWLTCNIKNNPSKYFEENLRDQTIGSMTLETNKKKDLSTYGKKAMCINWENEICMQLIVFGFGGNDFVGLSIYRVRLLGKTFA